jgi:hypothetical protein
MTVLYIILIVSVLAVLGVVAAVYLRMKHKVGIEEDATARILRRDKHEDAE